MAEVIVMHSVVMKATGSIVMAMSMACGWGNDVAGVDDRFVVLKEVWPNVSLAFPIVVCWSSPTSAILSVGR